MLKNIQHRLEDIEDGAPRLTEGNHHREHQQDQTRYRDFTDNQEEEQEGSYTQMRIRITHAGISRAHQHHKRMAASYYTRNRPQQLNKNLE